MYYWNILTKCELKWYFTTISAYHSSHITWRTKPVSKNAFKIQWM